VYNFEHPVSYKFQYKISLSDADINYGKLSSWGFSEWTWTALGTIETDLQTAYERFQFAISNINVRTMKQMHAINFVDDLILCQE
jgi:hypothetical protein